MPKVSAQTLYVVGAVALVLALFGFVLLWAQSPGRRPNRVQPLTLDQIPFDGAQAFKYLEQLCELGPRYSGSEGMLKQRELVVEHFKQLGAEVSLQSFDVRHPLDGSRVPMANVIATWHPERKQRILLCAHYDTRPFPDRDPYRPQGVFVGANDGASGVAVLMELGRHMAQLEGRLGVDFVLFDGEELVYRETDEYFYGSKYFAQAYANRPPPHRYLRGVLLDMVGDADLRIDQEPNSLRYARPVVQEVWNTAARLGVHEFSGRVGRAVNDDHMPLNTIARIPTIDLIDFDYPAWHTELDIPQSCSALSLAKVGWVVHEWLKTAVKP